MKKIITICDHERVCRIPAPPEGELHERLQWLDDRFGKSLAIELIYESLGSIIRKFDSGLLKSGDAFQFNLTVKAEIDGA